MRQGRFDRAAAEFAVAAELRPQDFWVHFYSGVCAYRERRWNDAVSAFTVALSPGAGDVGGPLQPRPGPRRRRRHEVGDRDFDRAIALNPPLALQGEGGRRKG